MIKVIIVLILTITIFFILALCKVSKISEQKAKKILIELDKNHKIER
ncbi:hypothetical protein [Clostridium botulinum]|nr:hypothetical protein [Clostridium botulinum]